MVNSDKIFWILDNFIFIVKDEIVIKIWIFDNNFFLEYKSRLKEYVIYLYIEIYFYDENFGFGYGYNYNLLKSDCYYGIICNLDILVDEEIVIVLVLLLKEYFECVMLVFKIFNEDGII